MTKLSDERHDGSRRSGAVCNTKAPTAWRVCLRYKVVLNIHDQQHVALRR
jgi:hypothetical protein